ncbi:MAG: hypothetical protein FJX60_00415 [Alphaproteobacteria bacterium]|nr:hypothetical protein [Alphaproteobacteria bacterium]
MPQAVQPQPSTQARADVVQLAQLRPIATQTVRAVAGPSRGRGSEGAKSEEKRSAAAGTEEKAADVRQAQRPRKRDGVTIDV